MKPTVSLAMIVKNEERFLSGCLESVAGVVNEIVILDTGSADRTRKIALEAGAHVFDLVWTGDFSEARNEALARCTGDWILYLDADERLAPGQEELFSTLIERSPVAAYNVHVRSRVSLQGNAETTQMMLYPRLFRRGPAVRFEGAVHEQIAPSILRAGGTIEHANLLIEHLGYAQGFETLRAKADRNLRLLERAVALHPDDWYSRMQIGKTEMLRADPVAASAQITRAMTCCGVPSAMKASMHNLLAEIALKGGHPEAAITHCCASLSLVSDQIGARWFLAGAYVNGGDFLQARLVLNELHASQCAGKGWSAEAEDIVVPEDAVLELLGKCCVGLDDLPAAADWFLDAMEKNPNRESALVWLMKVHERRGRPDLARHQFERAYALVPGNRRLMLLLAMVRKQTGDSSGARNLLDALLSLDPTNGVAFALKASWAAADGDLPGAAATLAEATQNGVVSDEINRCAFDIAFRAGWYGEALAKLQNLSHVFTPEQYTGLRERLMALQNAAPGIKNA